MIQFKNKSKSCEQERNLCFKRLLLLEIFVRKNKAKNVLKIRYEVGSLQAIN